jgi:hypothetical protein
MNIDDKERMSMEQNDIPDQQKEVNVKDYLAAIELAIF